MTVFADLISDDLQDFISTFKKKAVGHSSRTTHWDFPDLVMGSGTEDPGVSFDAERGLREGNITLKKLRPTCRNLPTV